MTLLELNPPQKFPFIIMTTESYDNLFHQLAFLVFWLTSFSTRIQIPHLLYQINVAYIGDKYCTVLFVCLDGFSSYTYWIAEKLDLVYHFNKFIVEIAL